MRCLTLATALRERGAECIFACRPHRGNLIEFIRERGFSVRSLAASAPHRAHAIESSASANGNHDVWLGTDWESDAQQVLEIVGESGVDWLVVDHYSLDFRWERTLRRVCRRLMVIDDLADRAHDCDLLLDQNFGRTRNDYVHLVPKWCKVFAGTQFVLLRPEFAPLRAYSRERRSLTGPKHLLIAMGGVDKTNATREVLEVLKQSSLREDLEISVLLGPHAPWIADVTALAGQMPWKTSVHVGTPHIAQVIADADLAIGSGGGGTYERIFMGLPAVLCPIAANQAGALRVMADAGLFKIFESPETLLTTVQAAMTSGVTQPPDVVSDGTATICHQMNTPCISLMRPRPFDLRRTFRWLQNPALRKDFSMKERPTRGSHFAYWRNALQATDRHFFSVLFNETHIGNAGIKNVNREIGEAELWLYLGESEWRHKGLGTEVMGALETFTREELKLDVAVLHVLKANALAIGLYVRTGYVPVEDRGLQEPAFDRESVMRMEKRL